jgi:hypothetical protein
MASAGAAPPWRDAMKRVALAALLAAATLAPAYGPPPAGPEADRSAPAGAARYGFLGSGNHHGSAAANP